MSTTFAFLHDPTTRYHHRHRYPSTTSTELADAVENNSNNNNKNLDKGFGLLELAGGIVPQGRIVQTAKGGWKFVWTRMMAELAPQDPSGNYQRPTYSFNGRMDDSDDDNDNGRYHLYVGNPCPWCHRAVLAVNIVLGLNNNNKIGMTRLEDNPEKASRGGWVFASDRPDPLGNQDLRQLYDQLTATDTGGGGYQGRCTAPLLVDTKTKQIVSNESADIVRMLGNMKKKNDNGDTTTNNNNSIELYPEALAAQIDETNDWVYRLLNNGVYRCGFATTQAAYDVAAANVRQGLDRVEALLSDNNNNNSQLFLCGDTFTESDLRLLPTILRFDGAYAPLFRAGGAHLKIRCDYPNIHRWLKRCWKDIDGVPESIDIADACGSYYRQLFPLNPGGIVPTPVTAADLGLEEED